mmetsp:Transcript_80553/g.176634  ORF Transcript_80553/g.176634 Transcript_80553/m.176634 type:complete len:205 (-) Transcript_80553:332-946(-)
MAAAASPGSPDFRKRAESSPAEAPVADLIAEEMAEPPTPSSKSTHGGPNLLLHKYTAGIKLLGDLARISRKASSRAAFFSFLLVVEHILAKAFVSTSYWTSAVPAVAGVWSLSMDPICTFAVVEDTWIVASCEAAGAETEASGVEAGAALAASTCFDTGPEQEEEEDEEAEEEKETELGVEKFRKGIEKTGTRKGEARRRSRSS